MNLRIVGATNESAHRLLPLATMVAADDGPGHGATFKADVIGRTAHDTAVTTAPTRHLTPR